MNKYIQKLIHEQFNIGNMELNNTKQKRNMNIFNKNIIDIEKAVKDILNDNNISGDIINELNDDLYTSIYKVKSKKDLQYIVTWYSNNHPDCSMNWLDVSGITDMSRLFSGEFDEKNNYDGDISKWDTFNVTDMSYMFYYAKSFNQSIGDWNVSSVTNMNHMFACAYHFNQPIGDWDVSNVTDMNGMFASAYHFNQPIGNWDVSMVTNMRYMFYNAQNFNQDISGWDVSNIDIYAMFDECPIKKEYKPKKYR